MDSTASKKSNHFGIFSLSNKNTPQPADTSGISMNSGKLSIAIDQLRETISNDYNEDIFKEKCKECLTNYGDNAKFRLADLALELKQNGYLNLAEHIFSVLDVHFKKTDFYRQYYSDLQGLKELADQPDCKVAAYQYGMELREGKNGLPTDKKEADTYLLKSSECGYDPAFMHFFNKKSEKKGGFFEELFSKPSTVSDQSPIRPACKKVIDPEERIKKAEKFFNKGNLGDAEREFKWAAQLKEIEILAIAKNYESKGKRDMALFCYEIAAKSGNREAKFKCMQIKASTGDAEQQYWLARSYFSGGDNNQHPAKNLLSGGEYLIAAIKQKYPAAMFMAAEMYMNWHLFNSNDIYVEEGTLIFGHDIYSKSQDPAGRVFKYLSKAAEAGHEEAKHLLKMLNDIGGDKQQICIVWAARCGNKAAELLFQKIKADKGDVSAMIACGVFYRDGGLAENKHEKNIPLAIEYFTKAANAGNQEAKSLLKQLHEHCLAQIDMKTSDNQKISELLPLITVSEQATNQTNASQLKETDDTITVPVMKEIRTQAETPQDNPPKVKREKRLPLPTPFPAFSEQTTVITNATPLKKADDEITVPVEEKITVQTEMPEVAQQEIIHVNNSGFTTPPADFSDQETVLTNASLLNQTSDETTLPDEKEIAAQSETKKVEQPEVNQTSSLALATPANDLSEYPTVTTNTRELNQTGGETISSVGEKITTPPETPKVDRSEMNPKNSSALPMPSSSLSAQKNSAAEITAEANNPQSPPLLTNLFLDSASITETNFLQDSSPLSQNLSPVSQPILNNPAEKTDKKENDTTDNSTTYIFIALAIAVPFATFAAYRYYTKES